MAFFGLKIESASAGDALMAQTPETYTSNYALKSSWCHFVHKLKENSHHINDYQA